MAEDNSGGSKMSDLPLRILSAIVMVAIAGSALWLGGWWWTALVLAVSLGVLWEWQALVRTSPEQSAISQILWLLGGAIYVLFAANTLAVTRTFTEAGKADAGLFYVALIVGTVIAVDIGAYFFGRALGGPKIAPKISPSKTWAGLLGGAVGASIVITMTYMLQGVHWSQAMQTGWIAGALAAVIAQAGDFFESWMKRRAGVKDSGRIIPGHGGLFDRVDGLLAVCFALGLAHLAVQVLAG